MLGWELPPHFAGGVGVVADGLSRSLAGNGTQITYVMPFGPGDAKAEHMRVIAGTRYRAIDKHRVRTLLQAYDTSETFGERYREHVSAQPATTPMLYGSNLLDEVHRFSEEICTVVDVEGIAFDVIHAHDWTTFLAGIQLKKRFNKPLVVHVHITEFDKSGDRGVDQRIYAIERAGMEAADRVIAVSQRIRDRCRDQYGIGEQRIDVVYNAVERRGPDGPRLSLRSPVVLFLGRVTLQKGPDYFVEAARRVLERRPDATFVLAGAGDMLPTLIERAAADGLADRMLFTGFVDRDRALELFRSADVFVMPSVSEPFGIVPLEAMDTGAPVIVSRQSGVSELLRNALKVDFWDTEALAARIVAALDYEPLRSVLREEGSREVEGLSWGRTARQIERIYASVLH